MKSSLSRRAFIILPLFILLFPKLVGAQRITYTTREVTNGLNVPWEMRIAPDGWLFFTERPGRISKVNPETGETRILLNANDCVLWHEAGMLGFDFHPSFPDSPYLYVAYVYNQPNNVAGYGVFRFTYEGDTLVDRVQLFGPATANFAHNGSRVVIREGKIYFSNGEIDQKELAQDVSKPHGKINRINLDGTIPEDNPFPGYATWSFGHRNPQGLDFGPTGILYSSEHGDFTDDEINLIEKGRNYGWPRITGFCDSASDLPQCEELNVRQPLAAFTPTLAASDITYFDQPSFPEWQHSILMASLRDQSLHQFKLSKDGTAILSWERYNLLDNQGDLCGRLRAICLSKDGRIYMSTGNGYKREETPDRIFEIIRTGIEPASIVLQQPSNESIIRTAIDSFSWRRPFLGALYQIQVATSSDFDPLTIVYQQETGDSSIFTGDLKQGIRYFWRVKEQSTNGPWSEIRYFISEGLSVAEDAKEFYPLFDISLGSHSILLKSRSESLNATVEVTDLLGRREHSEIISNMRQGNEHHLGRFAPGVYLIRVAGTNWVKTLRVVVP
jgi:aldose sugar dehydrogenase